MKSVDHSFYSREAWKQVRLAYLKKKRFLCERCGEPAKVVHHRQHLNADNIHDDSVCYGDDNLEALCFKCHAIEHDNYDRIKNKSHHKKRFKFDEFGHCTPL